MRAIGLLLSVLAAHVFGTLLTSGLNHHWETGPLILSATAIVLAVVGVYGFANLRITGCRSSILGILLVMSLTACAHAPSVENLPPAPWRFDSHASCETAGYHWHGGKGCITVDEYNRINAEGLMQDMDEGMASPKSAIIHSSRGDGMTVDGVKYYQGNKWLSLTPKDGTKFPGCAENLQVYNGAFVLIFDKACGGAIRAVNLRLDGTYEVLPAAMTKMGSPDPSAPTPAK